MTLLTNTAEDSELRIGAYLALMSCPSQDTVNQVKMVLTDEPVNQGNNRNRIYNSAVYIIKWFFIHLISFCILNYSWIICMDTSDQYSRNSEYFTKQTSLETISWNWVLEK